MTWGNVKSTVYLPQAMKLLLIFESISNKDVRRLVSGFETWMIWSKKRAVVRGSVGFLMTVMFDEFWDGINVVLRFIMNWVCIFDTVSLLFLNPFLMIYLPLLDIILLNSFLHIIDACARRRRRRLIWNHRVSFIAFFLKRSRQADSFLVFSFLRLKSNE